MRNIVDAILAIVADPKYRLKEYANTHNRVNHMGVALEEYIKDLFAGAVGESSDQARLKLISESFSFLGNTNNPPDSMLRGGGDAIEVKKIESDNSQLALNSSYPKSKLHSDSAMITTACRECEEWTQRDMIYAVGVVKGDQLQSLAFVYGVDYCADSSVYERVNETIKRGVEQIHGVEFAQTKELGRINRVDPLGITYMRVRGMWGIENPFKVFDYIYKRDTTKEFNFMAVINCEKFNSFDNRNELYEVAKGMEHLKIEQVEIKNPNNPAMLVPAVLISYSI